jgi:thiol:disulfide interchange protein DsbD
VTAKADPGMGDAIAVEAKANWLVCEKICVPEESAFHTMLPVGGSEKPSAEAGRFTVTDALKPRPSPFAATITADGKLTLAGGGLSSRTVEDAWFLPDHWGIIDACRAAAPDGNSIPSTREEDLATAEPYAREAVLAVTAGQPVPHAATRPYGCTVKYQD